MAKITGNIIMENVQGMIGKQVVVKKRRGKSYLSAPPNVDENRKAGTREQGNRDRFARSTKYAIDAMKKPDIKSMYAALANETQTAYNVAFKDAFHGPKIEGIISEPYLGEKGNIILIQATDNVKVEKVAVTIVDAIDNLVEEGEAIEKDGLNWMYTATMTHTNVPGSKIVVKAYDLPGNEAIKEVRL